MSTKALWYLTRGSGIVSLLLLTAAVVLGLLTAGRFARERWPRFVVEGLHRNVSLLASLFLLIHIASSVLDGFVPIHWLDAVVPFGAAYRPFWLGLGALSLDVLVAVAATSLLRRHLGHRAWRAVHWSAYACWLLAMLHSFGAGSDSGQGWMILVYLACGAAVLGALAWRLAATAKGAALDGAGAGPVGPVPLTVTGRRREV
ncbi:MAG: ferric reductase-like transmembrane domain-containing protein [Acidimicrobiales bacterium]|nr:ferric reductase-like transmembrane domain-containing protein [Acidimicrobiales bacterium]